MIKPTAYSGKPYPLTALGDREFEELVYCLYKADIEAEKYVAQYDKIDLSSGVGEQGRDCKLYYQGSVVGVIQCKNFETNINKPDFACELIKFILNYILDPLIIPNIWSFDYILATAKGFSMPTIDLAGEIKNRIEAEENLDKWITDTIKKSAHFKRAGFTIENTKVKIVAAIKAIRIKFNHSTDLNLMLQAHQETIGAHFFEVQKVIDVESFRTLLKELSSGEGLRQEDILNYAVDTALEYSKKTTLDLKSSITANRGDIQGSLYRHLEEIDSWCGEVSFSDLKRAKLTNQVYVELDMSLLPRRKKIVLEEEMEVIALGQLFQAEHRHYVLLGQPGAGKTTSMKYICYKLLRDPSFYSTRFSLPIVLRLRDLNVELARSQKGEGSIVVEGVIIKYLFRLFNINIRFGEKLLLPEESGQRTTLVENIVIRFLDELKVLLILDGFDELTIPKHRETTLQEIRRLALKLRSATIIVTSRTGEFPYDVEKADQYELCALTRQQISQFSHKWLQEPQKVVKFLKEISDSPFSDTTIKPLTLAHLCAIFERTGKIPDKPKTIYRKIINLLLEEWDEQRSVRRTSKYANFEIDRKHEFLSNLAYELITSFGGSVFSSQNLKTAYDKICNNYDLQTRESRAVVNEVESHTGLFIEASYNHFEFAHKSLQEFLAAEYIVKLPRIPDNVKILSRLPNELAIATTISSDPSQYFTELVLRNLYTKGIPSTFFESFIDRLIQEKPDFNAYSDEVVIALVALYSLYLDGSIVNNTRQLQLFYIDSLAARFEKFVDIVCKRNRKDVIHKYYEAGEVITTTNQESVQLLHRIRTISRYKLPEQLYSRISFLETT